MKLTYLASATVLVEDQGVKLLCDPWLVDGEYYGSWAHYPPCTVRPEDLNDVDCIYISHIHPDHFSRKTLERMRKDIPILIHSYEEKFLKMNLERMGFTVRELPHNTRTHVKGDMWINILAADNCNPELCAQFFGCGLVEATYGSTQIDSLCVIDNGRLTIVNTNDCPYTLTYEAARLVKEQYKTIDLLLVGYGGAGPYPQCFQSLTDEQRVEAGQKKKTQFLRQGEDFIRLFRPRWYLPFAGRYTLAGSLAHLNPYRGVPELEEASEYLEHSTRIDHTVSRGLLLNSGVFFDLESEKASQAYRAIEKEKKQQYIEEVLQKRTFDFESEPYPTQDALVELLPKAYERFERKRKEIQFASDTVVYIALLGGMMCKVSLNGQGYDIVAASSVEVSPSRVVFRVDPRLLKWILQGPRYAHWNNAEIGSHITFDRHPDIFERGLYHCMCFFHV